MQLEGESSLFRFGKEIQEIGHCGGQLIVNLKSMDGGQRGIQFGIRHSRPTPASIFGIYALPQGIPVGNMDFGGMDDSSTLPTQDCLPIFIASDSLGMFGHQCPRCKQYWRSDGAPSMENDLSILRPSKRDLLFQDRWATAIYRCLLRVR